MRANYWTNRTTSRRRILGGAAAAGTGLIGLGLAGCGDDDNSGGKGDSPTALPNSTPRPTEAAQPKKGGILRLAGGPLQANIDVHSVVGNNMYHYISNFLVRYKPDGTLEGDVAAALPEITDGGLTLIFKIRPEVVWQKRPPVNGRKFDAEDVVVVSRVGNESRFERQTEEKLEAWLDEYSLGEIWEKNVIGGGPH